jgi:hypothetical protein
MKPADNDDFDYEAASQLAFDYEPSDEAKEAIRIFSTLELTRNNMKKAQIELEVAIKEAYDFDQGWGAVASMLGITESEAENQYGALVKKKPKKSA